MSSEPTWDPLGYQSELPLRERCYPLGFALDLETNSPDLLEAARESWSGETPEFPDAPLRLRVLAVPAAAAKSKRAAPVCHGQGHLLTLIESSASFAACDLEAGFAFACLPEDTLRDHRHVRFYYLECAAYSMLTYQRLTAIHASCVSLGGEGILLCGRPGAGKSCLAFACARQGFHFVSDDAVYLVRTEPGRTVQGRPRFLRLKAPARDLFPEIRDKPAITDLHGEQVIELAMSGFPQIKTRGSCQVAHVVFLDRRQGGAATLVPLPADEAVERLVAELPLFSEEVTRQQVASVKQLVEGGAYRLVYGDFQSAVVQIHDLLGPKKPQAAP